MPLHRPDRYFDRISAIDVGKDVIGAGYSCVLLDMDNTILSRQTHDVPRDVRAWLARACEAGVDLCIVSNNWHASPYEWGGKLGIPVVAKACKPLPHGFLRARAMMGASRSSTVVVGDQISTDILGAHLLGMAGYLVCPLAIVDLKHTKVIRAFENALMGERQPETAMVESKRTQ